MRGMIKHLEDLEVVTSSRDLKWIRKKKNVYEKKQFSEFKTAKVNCQRKPYGQTGKNPSSCMEREESKSSVFSISVKLFPHVYLTTSEFRNNSAFPDFFCASKSS